MDAECFLNCSKMKDCNNNDKAVDECKDFVPYEDKSKEISKKE